MPVTGTVSSSAPGLGGAGRSAVATAGAGVAPRAPDAAARTSSSTIRPFGPVPLSCARFTPSSSASFLTRGVARGRSPAPSRPSPPKLGAAGDSRCPTDAATGSSFGDGTAVAASSSVGTGEMSAGTSPSAVSSRASSAPTRIVSPSCARISVRVPDTGQGNSTLTLSVLISTIGSYFSTLSPGFLSQRSIVPSVTVSPTSGIVRVNAMRGLPCSVGGELANSLCYLLGVRQNVLLEDA